MGNAQLSPFEMKLTQFQLLSKKKNLIWQSANSSFTSPPFFPSSHHSGSASSWMEEVRECGRERRRETCNSMHLEWCWRNSHWELFWVQIWFTKIWNSGEHIQRASDIRRHRRQCRSQSIKISSLICDMHSMNLTLKVKQCIYQKPHAETLWFSIK